MGSSRLSFQYPKGIHFSCNRCAKCCADTPNKSRTILLLTSEAQRISKEADVNIDQFAEKVQNFGPYPYRMKKTDEGKCTFLLGSSCRIYNLRPLVCRFYPFELKDEKNGTHLFLYTMECPCIGRGEELKRVYFERLFVRLAHRMKLENDQQ